MEIVCIKQINNNLTLNMIYNSITVDKSGFNKKNYKVKCDNGKTKWMPKANFLVLEELKELYSKRYIRI
jgi:hypothetical protein